MFCLVFLVRIFYPTKIRTSYFARTYILSDENPSVVFSPYNLYTKNPRAESGSPCSYFFRIRRTWYRFPRSPHFLHPRCSPGPAPLRSNFSARLASTSRGWWRLILVRYLWPRTIQSPYANRRRASHVGREGGGDAERGDCVRAMSKTL